MVVWPASDWQYQHSTTANATNQPIVPDQFFRLEKTNSQEAQHVRNYASTLLVLLDPYEAGH